MLHKLNEFIRLRITLLILSEAGKDIKLNNAGLLRFKISVIEVDDFENPSIGLLAKTYILTTEGLNILHIPAGHITAIQALETNSKLLVMADYGLGEVKDEYRYPLNYFRTQL